MERDNPPSRRDVSHHAAYWSNPLMIQPFSIARLPCIEFGAGGIKKLPDLIAQYGNRVLLVTGQRAFLDSSHG
ncbi:MAG: hypothetical protein R3F40_15680 [Candidatus Competibacteraceae bacterium]